MSHAVKTVTVANSVITFSGNCTFITIQNLGTNPVYFVPWTDVISVWEGICLPTQYSSFTVDNKLCIGSLSVISSVGDSNIVIVSDASSII